MFVVVVVVVVQSEAPYELTSLHVRAFSVAIVTFLHAINERYISLWMS